MSGASSYGDLLLIQQDLVGDYQFQKKFDSWKLSHLVDQLLRREDSALSESYCAQLADELVTWRIIHGKELVNQEGIILQLGLEVIQKQAQLQSLRRDYHEVRSKKQTSESADRSIDGRETAGDVNILEGELEVLQQRHTQQKNNLWKIIVLKAKIDESIVRYAMKTGLIAPAIVLDAYHDHQEALARYPKYSGELQTNADSFKGFDRYQQKAEESCVIC